MPEETLSLSSKVISYTNILENRVQSKGHQCLCFQDMQNYEIHGELSPNPRDVTSTTICIQLPLKCSLPLNSNCGNLEDISKIEPFFFTLIMSSVFLSLVNDVNIYCLNVVKLQSLFEPFCSPQCMHASMLSHFSCVGLFVTPRTVAHQAPLSMGFSRQG